ncbi:MAG: ROK family protein [Planctomycetes bacterium]|nr:ROK family protein [Planctomycetota bacterium]
MLTQPVDLRLANARRTLTAALCEWPCTKPELGRRTGLSQMTIGKVVRQLLEKSLLEEVPVQSPPQYGRPPAHLRPSSADRFVGIELGVRETAIYRIGLTGETERSQRRTLATPADLPALRALWSAWKAEVGAPSPECVLVAVPGVLDTSTPAIVYSPNLHWTEGRALIDALAADFDAPVVPVHDTQAQALGHLAARAGSDSFLLVDLTDGLGGAVVSEGRLLGGPLPVSGEIGHTAVPGNDRQCGCGARGCIETLAGRSGLVASFRRSSGHRGAEWADMREALAGGELPDWLEATLDALAAVVAGALNLLGFAEVVFVGDLVELHPDVLPRLREGLAQHSLLGRFGRIEARAAAERRQLGLLAAAVERVLLTARLT